MGAEAFLGVLGGVRHHGKEQWDQYEERGRAPPMMGAEPFDAGRTGKQVQQRRQHANGIHARPLPVGGTRGAALRWIKTNSRPRIL